MNNSNPIEMVMESQEAIETINPDNNKEDKDKNKTKESTFVEEMFPNTDSQRVGKLMQEGKWKESEEIYKENKEITPEVFKKLSSLNEELTKKGYSWDEISAAALISESKENEYRGRRKVVLK